MAVYPETDEEPEEGLPAEGVRGVCPGGQVASWLCASVSPLYNGRDATCSQGYRAAYTLQVPPYSLLVRRTRVSKREEGCGRWRETNQSWVQSPAHRTHRREPPS